MNISFIVALIAALASVLVAFVIEGGHLTAILSPTGFMIVVLGSIAATIMSFPLSDVKRIPKLFKVLMRNEKNDLLTLWAEVISGSGRPLPASADRSDPAHA